MPKEQTSTRNSFSDLDVAPSDFNQAIIRFAVVSGLLVYSLVKASASSLVDIFEHNFVLLTITYWFFSVFFLVWCRALNTSNNVTANQYRIRRIVGVIADLGAISAYTAIAGNNGLILYPIYLTTIIGYGYRFGSNYLYLSIAAGLVGFTIALTVNRTFAETSLVIAYYLGLILVPLYSLLLLKRHEKILQQLKNVNASRARFIANMSHELRTPLHAIISMNQVLKEDYSNNNPSSNLAVEKFNMVGDSAEHLLKLVNRVLDIASSDAKSFQALRFSKTNILESLKRSFSISTTIAFEKGIQPYLYISSNIPEYVNTSQTHLEEILVNIIGNAVKYTERGHVFVHAEAKNSQENGEIILSVRVLDSGIGIPESMLPSIFEPFTIGDDTSARKHYGTGLGLTITRQYIEAMGGAIEISSVHGSGTCVSLSLPLKSFTTEANHWENNLSCILITPSEISSAERMLFEKEGLNIGTMDWDSAARLSTTQEHVDLVFVDDRYASEPNVSEITQGFFAPIVLYSQTEPQTIEIGSNPHIYRSTVRPGVAQDLASIRKIILRKEDSLEIVEKKQRSLRILMADDNEINLRTAQLALESEGHTIDTVNDGELALEQLYLHEYHLVIMDMHMPGMNGIDAAKLHNFEFENPTPILLLTADATEEARDAAKEANVAAFLTKPIRPDELRKAVQLYARPDDTLVFESQKQSIKIPQDSRPGGFDDTGEYITAAQVRELLECGATSEDLTELIDLFQEDSENCIDSGLEALASGEFSLLQDKMHALKGAAAAVGAFRLQEAAEVLEKSSNHDLASKESTIRGLSTLLEGSLTELRALHNDYAPSTSG